MGHDEQSLKDSGASGTRLLLVGAPAALAGAVVFAVAGVGARVWAVQAAALCLAVAIASTGTRLNRREGFRFPAGVIIGASLLGLAAPLFTPASEPDRWLSIGPVSLYVAPIVLPALLIGCSVWLARGGRSALFASAAVVGASLLLALQPDASQTLALLVATAIASARSRSAVSIGAVLGAGVSAAWAFSQPDPLQPIAHVEGVFALALTHSLPAGIAVAAGAAALVIGLQVNASIGRKSLSVVAAYYAVLFACSIAGLTPAPLVGYGAGPVLGFGLLVAVASWLEVPASFSHEVQG